jgi:hypothetical protein
MMIQVQSTGSRSVYQSYLPTIFFFLLLRFYGFFAFSHVIVRVQQLTHIRAVIHRHKPIRWRCSCGCHHSCLCMLVLGFPSWRVLLLLVVAVLLPGILLLLLCSVQLVTGKLLMVVAVRLPGILLLLLCSVQLVTGKLLMGMLLLWMVIALLFLLCRLLLWFLDMALRLLL